MLHPITFQYTFEEYAEALTAIQKTTRQILKPKTGLTGHLWMIATVAAFYVALQISTDDRKGASLISAILAPFLPWLVFFIFAAVHIRRLNRNQFRAMWDADPTVHTPRTLTPYAEGIAIADPFSQTHARWQAFVAFDETKDLFLLYVGRFMPYIIPKRAFPTQAEVDQFRALCQHSISPRPAAFPILPPTSTQPIPPPLPPP